MGLVVGFGVGLVVGLLVGFVVAVGFGVGPGLGCLVELLISNWLQLVPRNCSATTRTVQRDEPGGRFSAVDNGLDEGRSKQ